MYNSVMGNLFLEVFCYIFKQEVKCFPYYHFMYKSTSIPFWVKYKIFFLETCLVFSNIPKLTYNMIPI